MSAAAVQPPLNQDPKTKIALRFLQPSTPLTLTNILTGEKSIVTLDAEKKLEVAIPTAPGYQFLKYEK